MKPNVLIGFIGQGWIGKHYADEFEARGYSVVRYALEEPYAQNKEKISACDVVFVAVPTPTDVNGFDDSYVRDAIKNVSPGTVVVVKSTLVPGTTKKLQEVFNDLFILHSPEFLAEKTAAHDAANPNRNLIGIPKDTAEFREKAELIMDILPDAPYKHILDANDAELVKYAGNCFLYSKVLFMNILYDVVQGTGGDWERVRDAFIHDPRIGISHTEPVHSSGHVNAPNKIHRGAGGHCFIKDFEAFRRLHESTVNDKRTNQLLKAMVDKNNELLVSTEKDLDLLNQVYGDWKQFK